MLGGPFVQSTSVRLGNADSVESRAVLHMSNWMEIWHIRGCEGALDGCIALRAICVVLYEAARTRRPPRREYPIPILTFV